MTEPLHKLGEVLRSAREAKGMDLARVERETKIRTRYLAALEEGDYTELPGAVYTKGFLRNYGTFLGLDPEYLIDLYRLETDGAAIEPPSPAPPRPLAVRPARAFVLTPGTIAAALLTVAVVAFVGYLVYEFVTFGRTPGLQVTDPVGDVANWSELQYTIKGTTVPNATVTVDGPRTSQDVTADTDGTFSVEVSLVPGSNLFTIVATDPVTQRSTPERTLTIDVNLSTASPTPGARIAITAPVSGATQSGSVQVTGTAPAGLKVRVSARLTRAGPPGFTVQDPSGQAVSIPTVAVGTVVSADATAENDGIFRASLALSAGAWEISAGPAPAATPSPMASGSPIAQPTPAPSEAPASSPAVSVTVTAPKKLVGSIRVSGARSYLLVLQDNVPLAGVSGLIASPGATIDVQAGQTLVIRAGNAVAVTLTINGVDLGVMGGSGQVVEWHISVGG